MQLPELARVASIGERTGRVKASLRNSFDAMQRGGWAISKGCASWAAGRGWRRFEGHRQLSGREIEKPTDPPSQHPSLWSGAHGYPRSTGWLRLPMVLLAWLLSVVAAQSQKPTTANLPTLTRVEQIREMTIEEAGRGYPVRIRGVVTYYNWDAGDLFIQDSAAGIWVSPGQTKLALHHGEFVQVDGFSGVGDLAPVIEHAHFRSLGEAPMPNPRRPTSDELASGRQDSQWIELQGVVRSVAEREGGLVLNVSSGAFECSVFVLKYPSLPTDIVDGQVRVRGVFGGLYDPSSIRFIGFHVLTPSWADVKVLERPTQRLSSVPVRPLRLFLRLTPEGAFTHRVHVQGVVTFQQLGRSLCIRDREGALLVNTTQPTPLKVGDLIDATGYPAIGDYTVIMRDAIFQRVGAGPASQPVAVSPEKLRAGNHNADLVRLSARLLNCTTRPGEEVLELQAGEVIFRAVLNTRTSSSPIGSLRAGSLLQLTGVSIVEADKNHQAKGFEILLRFPADVVVLELPSWWTARRVSWLLIILAGIVFWISFWVAVLRRRVEERTETIRATLESTADGILVVNSVGKIVAYNRKFAEMWRIPESVLASRDDNVALSFVLSQLRDPDAFLTRVRQTYADHDAQTDDVIEFKDGRVFERHSEPQRLMGRDVGRVWGFRNVTERKRAEERLRESEQFNREVIANAQEGVAVFDREFRYLVWNRFMEELTGLPASEALGKHAFDLFPHLREQKVDLLIRRALAGEVVHGPDTPFHVPTTGNSGWVSGVYSPHFGASGQIRGVIATIRDITERKRAEEALLESQALLNSVVNSTSDLIWSVDAKSLGLLTFNQGFVDSFLQRLGIRTKAGMRIEDLLPTEELRQQWHELYQRALGEGSYTIEYHMKTVPRTLQLSFNVLARTGVAFGVSVFAKDITERRRAEEAIRASEQRYRLLFERNLAGVCRATRDGRFLDCNDAYARIFGYQSREEMLAQPVLSVYFDLAEREAYWAKLRERGTLSNYELRLRRKDGSEVWVLANDTLLDEEVDRQLAKETTLIDITERKQAEEALIEERHLLHTLMENLPDTIYFKDRESRFTRINKALAKAFRLKDPAQAVGKTDFDFFAEEHAQQAYADEQEIIRTGQPTLAKEEKETWPDGRETWASTTKMPLRDAHGNILGTFGVSRDITERKRAERVLEERTAYLNALIEISPLGIITLDTQCRVHMCNPAFERLFLYRAAEIEGANLDKLLAPPESVSEALELTAESLSGTSVHTTTRRRRKDGTLIDVEIHGIPLVMHGELVGQLGLYHDVTERKRAEAALIEERHLLHTLMDNLPDVIYFKDRESRLTQTNKANAKKFGLSDPAQAVGKTDFDFFTPEHAQEACKDEQEIIRTGQPMLAKEEKETWPDGRETWVSTTKMPLRDAQGQIVGTFGISRDVTERKRAEEALRESEERFRRFIENVPLGVCRTTPDGRVLMANPALVRMLGYDSWQELASRNLESEAFEAGYPRSEFREQIERKGEVGSFEAAWKRRDGSVMFVRESARAFRADDGRVLYYDCIVEDVTERRQLGEQLRQAQKMEAVGCLAGGVAHDFNNLLTVVIGFSDLLLKRVSARGGMRSPLEEIKKAAERAASLTRQLLAFSRKQMLQPQILDLNSLLTSVDEMLRRMIGEDIELATHLPSSLGRVKADPGQIEQVIMNLAVNARDAMPQGGQLTLEAANVELDSSYASRHEGVLPGHYVMIAMSDTGIGMDAKTQAHIFEPFFTTKEVGKGTGLGLAMVYGIVKQSGGSIRVYSEPGKGTTFRVYLPRIDEAVEVIAPTNVPVDELSRGSETILLAEDEEAVRSLVRGVLESTGYQVLETKGANDALEVGERHRKHIHLLLTDVVMPQMSGAELVKHLAPLHPETKVLYMSGYTDHAVVRHGLLNSSTAFLQKPFTPDALALKVREVLDGAARQGTGLASREE